MSTLWLCATNLGSFSSRPVTTSSGSGRLLSSGPWKSFPPRSVDYDPRTPASWPSVDSRGWPLPLRRSTGGLTTGWVPTSYPRAPTSSRVQDRRWKLEGGLRRNPVEGMVSHGERMAITSWPPRSINLKANRLTLDCWRSTRVRTIQELPDDAQRR